MRKLTLRCAAVSCFIAAVAMQAIHAAEPANPDRAGDPVAAELERLRAEYVKVQREWFRELPPDGGKVSDSEISDEEWLRQDKQLAAEHPGPDDTVLPRYLALAKAHPESPFALDALAFVIMRGGYHTGDVHGEPWRMKEQAIDLVQEHHLADPRAVHVFGFISGSLPSQKEEAFLRHVFENGPDRTTRAAAGYNLACYFRNRLNAQARTEQIKGQARVANNERHWKLVVTPYLEEKFPCDKEELLAEIDRVLARVIDEYSDVPATDWNWSGPNRAFFVSEVRRQPKTYGSLAETLRFELNHLLPGRQAPDIEGTDAAGVRFRLSDYRGKVVLLTFSANWCGGCVELYPLERDLVEKYRGEPFVLLSVSRDESIETLKSSTASGTITWRCWWDGMRGPIYRTWNSPGAPTIYLLDHEGVIQDVNLNRNTPPEEFERAIAPLVKKAAAASSPSR